MLPKNEITITPEKLYNLIIDIIDTNIISYDYNEQYIKLLKDLKNEIGYELKKTYNWSTVMLSHKVCDHIYTENSKEYGNMCGKRIDIKTNDKNYKCSIHVEKSKHTPKKRKVDDSLRCPGLNMYGEQCRLRKQNKYNGYCRYHYQEDKIISLESDIKKEKEINLKSYVNNMITNYMDFSENVKYTNIEEKKNNESLFYTYKKVKNISSSIDVIYDGLYKINDVKEKEHNVDIRYYLNNNVKIINEDKGILKDISVYNLYDGKKIDICKLIEKYKKMEKMYNYIKKNNKYYEYKKYNNNKNYYIREKEVIELVKLILIRIDKYKDELIDFSPQTWIYILNELTEDIESYIIDFSNIDEKYKIYI